MLVIRVLLNVQPENQSRFIELIKEDRAASQQFEGCNHWEVYSDTTDPNNYLIYEEWETQAQFDAYKASDHFKQIGPKIFPLIAGDPNSAYYAASALPVT